MNLDFGILWIEDYYNQEEEATLRRRVNEAGFNPDIETMPNGEGIDDKARENNLYSRFDFILLDYKLRDEFGDVLAPTIRQKFPSTTILFYSGTLSQGELRDLIAKQGVEGVFCSTRSGFIERAGDLIAQTANSLKRLSGMRGLAMQVVAECDELMRCGIQTMTRRCDDCGNLVQKLDESVLIFFEEAKAKYEQAMDQSLEDRLKSRSVDSGKLHKHFRRLTRKIAANGGVLGLDGIAIDRLRELRQSTAQYDEAVLYVRNVLGHASESKGPDGWVLEGADFSLADFPVLRQTFAEHIDAFRAMIEIIQTLDCEQSE